MKSKLLLINLAGCLLFSAAAYASESDSATTLLSIHSKRHYLSNWDQEHSVTTAVVEYPSVSLSDEDAVTYPELESSLEELNAEIESTQLGYYADIQESAAAFLSDGDASYFDGYTTTESASIRRADSGCLSLLCETYYYSGSAHGYYGSYGYNYDTITGKKLSLWDVVLDAEGFTNIMEEKLHEAYPEAQLGNYESLAAYYNSIDYEPSWTLDPTGLTCYFNPYELGTYAEGEQIVTLSFAEYGYLFDSYYQSPADNYAVELTSGVPYYTDFDSDGSQDQLLLYFADSTEHYASLSGSVNGNEFSTQLGCYRFVPTLMHLNDGRDYLYVDTSWDNDYKILYVYEVTTSGITPINDFNLGRTSLPGSEADYFATIINITDPLNFSLSARTDILGTASGSVECAVGEDGTPVYLTEGYLMNHPRQLTVLKDISGTVVTEDGTLKSEGMVIAGSTVTTYRTDGETYMDLRLADDTLLRVNVDNSDWPHLVNGVDESECFDGIQYAG